MRMLLPIPGTDDGSVDPIDVYLNPTRPERPWVPGRPWVIVNMVASIDGGSAVDGLSGGLGGPADQEVFALIRAAADVILVAAGTVRAETYGPPRTADHLIDARRTRGQAPHPRLAIVSGSLDLDPRSPPFAGQLPNAQPLVVTSRGADPARRAALQGVAEIVVAGEQRVDVAAALDALGQTGVKVVLAEGGPSLVGQLVEADRIDEFCLTLAPVALGGDSSRIARGGTGALWNFDLAHVLCATDGTLLLRYLRRREHE